MCGEQRTFRQIPGSSKGSPPRVRGTGRHTGAQQRPVGITPACAGNSPPEWSEALDSKDHPRVCGEQPLPTNKMPSLIGSPPRVRGTASHRHAQTAGGRITPACAGNSILHPLHQDAVGDHPRVCGEQLLLASILLSRWGSPPRVRGTANTSKLPAKLQGITPACAGNSLSYLAKQRQVGITPACAGNRRGQMRR